ncbi:Ku protein [Roseomonas sp. JC162]|uniref:Non-homologous end joining protein Ku n=1 Tax=Neoroseomonas marina TaxID=1232220 RepID=A0A848EBB5_9PROT|nr:Ku protein [Neoroseomonas marina]NMJ41432.1 Ku protein [Neoroseomonas marina]
MAQRPSWEGHLRLSLVSCPVALYSATSRAGEVSFRLINPETGNRIRQMTVDAETGEEVQRRDLVKGYEIERDRFILLTEEEIRDVRLESTKTIDIERFVKAEDIDRIWWEDPYYLAPSEKAGIEAFVVIREALRRSSRIAIGRVTIHTRERMVALEPRDAGILVTTLRSHDDIRPSAEVFDDIPARRADPKMVEIAEQIIGQQAGDFDPSGFVDRYEDALRELIRSKQDGGDDGTAAPPPSRENVIDLMEALRQSLSGSKKGRAAAAAKAAPASKGGAKPKPARARPARRRSA